MDIMGTRIFGSTFGHVKIMTLSSLQLKALVFMVWIGMSIREASAQTYTLSDGDVVKCIPMKDQPSLKGLTNATYVTAPTSLPTSFAQFPDSNALVANQTFFDEVGECPTGTIPFLISAGNETGTVPSNSTPFDKHREWAYGYYEYRKIFGAEAIMNIWTPQVNAAAESSSTQLWLTTGFDTNLNNALAGYQVDLSYGNFSRLFISWTADGGGRTGCEDLKCPGFIQVSNKVLIRGAFKNTSSDGDDLYEIKISMFKDESSSELWLMFNNEVVGYWPNSIYPETATSMRTYAEDFYVGGRVLADDSQDGTTHTKTDMGSGQPVSQGYRRAAYIRNVAYITYGKDYAYDNKDPSLPNYDTKYSCYSFERISVETNPTFETAFFYGGTGYSSECLLDPSD